MLDFTPEPTYSTVPLTVELGDSIYDLIKEKGTMAGAIQASIYDPENIIAIEKEVERILMDRETTSEIISVDKVLADFPLPVVEPIVEEPLAPIE